MTTGQLTETFIIHLWKAEYMTDNSELGDSLFPYENFRPIQDQLVKEITEAIKNKEKLIAHAPTGLGKSVASIAPALAYALENDLTVFFLTSRHTQHTIVIDTLKEILEKHQKQFMVSDIIGKRWLCAIPGIETLYSSDFADYCRHMKEHGKCEFYNKTRKSGELTEEAKKVLKQMQKPMHTEETFEICKNANLCPYEMQCALAKKASVIVSDYYYIFNESIRNSFFSRTDKELGKSIIIVDEAHNLPSRARELMTKRLTMGMLSRAIKEAKKFGFNDTITILQGITEVLNDLAKDLKSEKIVTKQEFIDKIPGDFLEIIEKLAFIGDTVRETEKQSYVGSVGDFLDNWLKQDEGFARILSVEQKGLVLSYRCLDPSIVTKEVIEKSYSTIVMSGTLTPTEMYRDLLGMEKNCKAIEYNSPFPRKNRLNLVIPKTTTKYTSRSPQQFKNIAEICAEIVNTVPGNTAIFFPSYYLLNEVNREMQFKVKKTVYTEHSGMSKKEKAEILKNFKNSFFNGAVLMAATLGSFGEGIDYAGDLLKCVVIVGLPLDKPDLETQQLIKYYDNKFGKGWDYGYLQPAFNKALQSSGRCIRSEKDRGVITFLDERYVWRNYSRLFPKDWDMEASMDYVEKINQFFS